MVTLAQGLAHVPSTSFTKPPAPPFPAWKVSGSGVGVVRHVLAASRDGKFLLRDIRGRLRLDRRLQGTRTKRASRRWRDGPMECQNMHLTIHQRSNEPA